MHHVSLCVHDVVICQINKFVMITCVLLVIVYLFAYVDILWWLGSGDPTLCYMTRYRVVQCTVGLAKQLSQTVGPRGGPATIGLGRRASRM